MVDQLCQDHRDVLTQIATKEGLTEFTFEVNNSGAVKGDNYLGVIKLVTIVDMNANKRLNLVLKCAQSNEKFREMAPVSNMYCREAFMYNELLPEFVVFQKENNMTIPFMNFPKIYGSLVENKNECVVVENITNDGYKMWDRKTPMNHDHVSLVFATYAKFHAISMAYAKLQPDKFNRVTESIKNSVFSEIIMKNPEGWLEPTYIAIKDALRLVEGNERATEGLEKFQKQFQKFMFVEMRDEKYNITAVHGDSWCNNIMFKYGDKDNSAYPTDIRIVDWQLSVVGTPIRDISFFLISSCGKEVFDKVDIYLDIYYNSVSETLKDLDCDPEEVFPRSLLEEHWNKYAKWGLYLAVVLLKITLDESDDTPDLVKAADNGHDNLLLAFNSNYKESEVYKKRLTDVIMFYVERGLI